MILEIKVKQEPISIMGKFDPVSMDFEREAYIDGKKCPPGLTALILLGLDTATDKYLDLIERMIRQEGHTLGMKHYL